MHCMYTYIYIHYFASRSGLNDNCVERAGRPARRIQSFLFRGAQKEEEEEERSACAPGQKLQLNNFLGAEAC